MSISITLIGQLLTALPTKLEQATHPPSTAGKPDIAISSEEVTRIIAFQHYTKYMRHQPDLSLRIQDYATIAEDSFNHSATTAGAFDFATRSFLGYGKKEMNIFLQKNTSGITHAPSPSSEPTGNIPKNKLVDDFHRSRREPTSFQTLNKIEDFAEWNRCTQIQASAHTRRNRAL